MGIASCYPSSNNSIDAELAKESKLLLRKPYPSQRKTQNWLEQQTVCTVSIIEHVIFTEPNPKPSTFDMVQRDEVKLTVPKKYDYGSNTIFFDSRNQGSVLGRRRAFTISTPIQGHHLSGNRPFTLTISKRLPSVSAQPDLGFRTASETSAVETGRGNQSVQYCSQSQLLFSMEPEPVPSSSISSEIKYEPVSVSNKMLNISRPIQSISVEPKSDSPDERNTIDLTVLHNTYTPFPCVLDISCSLEPTSVDPVLVQSLSENCQVEPKRLSNTVLSISTQIRMVSVDEESESLDSPSGVGHVVPQKPYTELSIANFSVSNQVTLISDEQADESLELPTGIGNAVPQKTYNADPSELNISSSLFQVSVDPVLVQPSAALRHIEENQQLTISTPPALISIEPDPELVNESSGSAQVDLQQAYPAVTIVDNVYFQEESSSDPIDFSDNHKSVPEVRGRSIGCVNILGKDSSASSIIVFYGRDSSALDQDKFLTLNDESSSNPLNFDES